MRTIAMNGRTSVGDLSGRFMAHAHLYYAGPTGTLSSEYGNYRQVVRVLRAVASDHPVELFGPQALRTVREAMILCGWHRKSINRQIVRVRSIFRWGVEHELCPVGVYSRLSCVAPLRAGRTLAAESTPREAVCAAHIEAVRALVSSPVRGLIDLQLATGARPGEILRLRTIDLDMADPDLWRYRPEHHKNAHREKQRVIWIGPEGQAVIRRFMDRPITDYLFSPREASMETRRRCGPHIYAHYTTDSYRRAIARACRKAGIPTWSPHQLRHTCASRLRKDHGEEAVRLVLGHGSTKMSRQYGE